MTSPTLAITRQTIVTLSYKVTDTLGDTLSESAAPEAFLIGSEDLLPKIQDALMGQTAGFTLKLHLEPEDAFGDYDATLMIMEPRKFFPTETAEGLQFEVLPAGCTSGVAGTIYTVTDVTDDVVMLDGNHPLAGIAVRFELQVLAVREATLEEVGAGSVLGGSAVSVVRNASAGGRLH
jgi:FKBP-type peptidyl-prolyl cis-trans isomerase SlyD